MSDVIKKIKTKDGDKQIDYDALANLPVSDVTLTQEGSFADAKIVGEKINKLLSENLERKNEISVERARINALNALEEGSTTGDAELMDGRTDYKGNTHVNIGEHIRAVSSQLSKEKVSMPKDSEGTPQTGTVGQVLESAGDGTTRWANITVTTENITNALGYKPADQEDVSKLSEDVNTQVTELKGDLSQLSEEIDDMKQNGTGGLEYGIYVGDTQPTNGVMYWLDTSEDTPVEPDEPIIPDEPEVPEVTLSSISATYTGGEVTVGTALTDLTRITVKATYSDGSTKNVTGYTLSGTIAEGDNTITVSYNGKTTTFTVVGVSESSGDTESVTVTSYSNNPDATTGNVRFITDPFSFYNAKSIKITNKGTASLNNINVIFETSSESYPEISRTIVLTYDGDVAIIDPTTITNFNIANGTAFLEVVTWYDADLSYEAEITY